MITKTIYASQAGARLDGNVGTGGGTDDTTALQKALDLAPECGGVHLVMDGAALVTSLRVHSNTTIECLGERRISSGDNVLMLTTFSAGRAK